MSPHSAYLYSLLEFPSIEGNNHAKLSPIVRIEYVHTRGYLICYIYPPFIYIHGSSSQVDRVRIIKQPCLNTIGSRSLLCNCVSTRTLRHIQDFDRNSMLVQGEPTTGVRGDHIIYTCCYNTQLDARVYHKSQVHYCMRTGTNRNTSATIDPHVLIKFFFYRNGSVCSFNVFKYTCTWAKLFNREKKTKSHVHVLVTYTSHTNSLRIPKCHHRINAPLNVEQSLVLRSVVQSMGITCAQSRVKIVGIGRESSLGLC